MNIFLSWSGERSHQVALLLGDWLGQVIQAIEPWISSRDLDRGALWFGEISDQLKETTIGIVCLTQENKNRPWILFESGALAKGLSEARVCPFLIDLKSKDIDGPLAQFNHTEPNKKSMFALVKTLNNNLPNGRLKETSLQEAFEVYWPKFESKFKQVISETPADVSSKPRNDSEVFEEILQNTRELKKFVRTIQSVSNAGVPLENINSAMAASNLSLPGNIISTRVKRRLF